MQLINVSKTFGVNEILTDISFILEEKEKAAIVGVNGAGKTTLFKIITGEYAPDGGTLAMGETASIGYLPQNSEIDSENTLEAELLTVFDDIIALEANIRTLEKEMGGLQGEALEAALKKYGEMTHSFEERRGYEYKSRVRGVIKGLDFTAAEENQRVNTFSGGQKTRIALGKLLLSEPDLLLLDEPTNHLDVSSIEWLEDYLKTYAGAILIISHDRYFIDKVATKIIEIENKKSTVYIGNYTTYARTKAVNREIELKHYFDQQKEIKRQEEVIKQLRSFNREKSIKRAESREKLLDKIERVEKPEDLPEKMRIALKPRIESGNDVLFVDGVAKSFGKKHIFSDATFDIKKGERVALIGVNGVGKTTLFKIIMGLLTGDAGRVTFGTNVKTGYYDQEHEGLDLSKDVFGEIADSYPRLTNTQIRNVLAAFVFTGEDVFKPMAALSGGERGRVALAKIMLSGANFLILDEPTNHLDMYSKEILEEALRNYTGTCLYISHDRYFINNTAEKVVELTKDGARIYLGNYDYYLEKKKELPGVGEAVGESTAAVSANKDGWVKRKEQESSARKRQTLITRLEKDIHDTEAAIETLAHKLTDEAICRDADALNDVYSEKSELEARLEELYEQWGELQE